MKKVLTAGILMMFMVACGPSEQDIAIEKVYGELMEGHDEVMPKSMLLPKVKTKILAKVADLPEFDSLKTVALDLSHDLTKANEAMYTWMDEFAAAMNDVEDKSEKLKLYTILNLEIITISDATNSVMEKANTFLGKNE
ncbi:MAG: hypothetical protein ACI8UX_000262 [Psychromonas sp.]|jgi:hypothetical protein